MGKGDNMKRLLIIGGGVEQVRAYEIAREMGIYVIGVDRNPEAPALAIADEKIIISTYDVDAVVKAAKEYHSKYKINGVMTIAHDAMVTVASVAEALNLPGIKVQSAILATNKYEMKKQFLKDKVNTPSFIRVENYKEFEEAVHKLKTPAVIKPIDSCASRGVLKITYDTNLKWAYEESQKNSRSTSSLQVEKFIPGPQFSVEGMMYRGNCYIAMIALRNYEDMKEYLPYMIENGGTLPANLDRKEKFRIRMEVKKAAESLGIINGAFKADVIMPNKKKVVILEMAARLGGGYMSTHSIPETKGIDLVTALINISLGIRFNPKKLLPTKNRVCVLRFFFPPEGKIKSITGYEEISKKPWALVTKMYVNPGDKIDFVKNHTMRAGMILVVGDTEKEANNHIKEAFEKIKIEVENC